MTPVYPYALPFHRYRQMLARDYARLQELAGQALTAAVPACPGWHGAQLVRHTALVYLQKAEIIRTGTRPQGKWIPEDLLQMEPVSLLEESHHRLMGQFDSHDPADPAESWMPDDQTVGFWIRRLTHETSIHRCDIEAALDLATPIDGELAVDGIDEVLTVMLRRGGPDETASGATVVLQSEAKTWSAVLSPDAVAVTRENTAAAAGRVTGQPGEVLLWLWGRGPLPQGSTDNAAVAELRRRLASAT